METREAPPAHFLFKIDSFSLLLESEIEKFESKEFAGGEHKWRLIIYPNGDEIGKGSGHISVHLAMADKSYMFGNWEVNVVVSIFLFNQICDNYSSLGMTRRFHSLKSEWGFSKFISKDTFSDPSNGYLVNDNCVFGAEVFVIKRQAVIECLTLKSVDISDTRDIIIPNFSEQKEWYSELFAACGHKWKICVYPKGDAVSTGKHVSVYLHYVGSDRVKANYTLCIKNQLDDHKHKLRTFKRWFSVKVPSWGSSSFTELASIQDPKNGFIVEDSFHLNVKISVEAAVRGSALSTLK